MISAVAIGVVACCLLMFACLFVGGRGDLTVRYSFAVTIIIELGLDGKFKLCYHIIYMAEFADSDIRKDLENQRKHGVSFRDAREAFTDPHRLILEDLDHST